MVESLDKLFEADTTFLARRLSPNAPMVRVLTAWKDGAHKESRDYDLHLAGQDAAIVFGVHKGWVTTQVTELLQNAR